MNWVCICGTFVSGKRFCSRCQHVRFRLDRAEILDYFGPKVGTFSNGLAFNLPINYLASHVLVAGQTGTGKTRFAMNVSIRTENSQSVKKVKLLIVDVEGEWKGIIPMLKGKTEYYDVGSNLRINPFDLDDPALVRELMRETVFRGIEKEYVDLSAQMNFVLQEAVAESSNMEELIGKIQNYNGRKLTGLEKTKTALMVRLDPFLRSPLREIFFCKKSNPDLNTLGESNIVIDLHALDSKVAYGSELRLIYNTITTYFLRKMLRNEPTDSVTKLFVADEAQLLVPKILQKIVVTESWPATEFATRLRKRGCGLVLITQSPSNIEKDIVKNTATKIVFRLQSSEDIKLISDSAGFIDPVEYQYLSDNFVKLSQKQAIVFTDTFEPFLITADNFSLRKFIPVTAPEYRKQTYREEHGVANKQPDRIDNNEENFLRSIRELPFIGVAERRSLLGWDESQYSEVVSRLVGNGIIEKQNVRMGQGRPRVLYQLRGSRPSIKHEYYVQWIIGELANRGIVCRAEKVGPDIQIPLMNLAINVELGSSNVFGNITKALKDYAMVIVCSDDKTVLDDISKTKAQNVLCAMVQDVPALV